MSAPHLSASDMVAIVGAVALTAVLLGMMWMLGHALAGVGA